MLAGMKPVLRYALVGVSGIAIGVLGGAVLAWRYITTTWLPVTDLFVVVQAATWSTASRGRDPAAYEDALRAYIRVLDTAMQRDSTGENRRIYTGDKALTLMRLSELVERRGAEEDAERLRQEAGALCPGFYNGCNVDSLADLVRKLDRD